MDSASQSTVCDASQLSTIADSRTNFWVSHTGKKAEHTPATDRYHGVYHPPATGDGQPH